jgi:hypothetical protein
VSLTALIVARTGCSWHEVWHEYDVTRIDALLTHWQREPTVDQLAAAWLGYKPPSERSTMKAVPIGRAPPGLRAMLGGAGLRGKG